MLPVPVPKLLTYHVPEALATRVVLGSRVLVPLGARKIFTGLVVQIHTQPPTYPTKRIVDALDDTPIVNHLQLRFIYWLATYYLCTLGEVLLAALPNGFRLSSQSSMQLHPEVDLTAVSISAQEQPIVDVLKRRTSLTYTEAVTIVGQKDVHHLVQSLIQKRVLLLFESVREKYTPKKVRKVRLNEHYIQDKNAFELLFELLKKHARQLDVLLKYLALVPVHRTTSLEDHFVDRKELIQTGAAASSLRTLIKKNIFIEETVIVSRFGQAQPASQTLPVLSQAQDTALVAIRDEFQDRDAVLLHGVTASGKTEVYIHLIHEVIQGGQQVLYLLPEIALTTQMVRRLQKTFGNQVSVYHSRYSDNERVEVWNRLLQGKSAFVLGTRSALFLPFSNLGLIIVDEEHETSYKQSDAMPRYHARDAALMLAQLHRAKVLLGSATPSLESYYHAQNGKYGFVTLGERFGRASLPEVVLANMRVGHKKKTLRENFTEELLEALSQALGRGEQAIIFQNRRGYAPYVVCEACEWVPMCVQCAVSLTYHQYNDYLQCHYCGYRVKVPPTCDACGTPHLKNAGFGTERLEETLQSFFSDKHVRRMDLDTTRGKHGYDRLIRSLEQGSIDILVGTKMLTKGLDFGSVSLVGVLDVDRLLHLPDFRAGERCFQLLIQVSGRAGRRATSQGKVIIQTNNPQHPILRDVVRHDYTRMYRRELQERKRFLYPPYVRLVKITLKHANKKVLAAAASLLAEELRRLLQHSVLGPQEPVIARIKTLYLMDIWVKIKKGTEQQLTSTKALLVQARQRILTSKVFRQTKVILDVDPA